MGWMGRRPFLAAWLSVACTVLVMGGLQARPQDGQDVAAIFPPWIGSGQAIERIALAGGTLVRMGIADTILVAHSDGGDFPQKLHDQGAWLVIDPVALGGCLTRAR